MDKILTFSVAAYNVEDYLYKTLESISSCSRLSSIECIIVNDGSKDRTLKIAEDFVRLYPGTFRIIDKENGGYGSTINASIHMAQGCYYKLLDGDDWVDSKGLDMLISCLEGCDADCVITGYTAVFENVGTREVRWVCPSRDGKIRDFESIELPRWITMHALAFKTAMLKNPPLCITEHSYYTDFEYMIKGLLRSETIVSFDVNVYMYRLGRDGQSVSTKSMKKNIEQKIGATLNAINLFTIWDKSNENKPCKRQFMLNMTFDTINNRYHDFLAFGLSNKANRRMRQYDSTVRERNHLLWEESISQAEPIVRVLRKTNMKLFYPLAFAYSFRLKLIPVRNYIHRRKIKRT